MCKSKSACSRGPFVTPHSAERSHSLKVSDRRRNTTRSGQNRSESSGAGLWVPCRVFWTWFGAACRSKSSSKSKISKISGRCSAEPTAGGHEKGWRGSQWRVAALLRPALPCTEVVPDTRAYPRLHNSVFRAGNRASGPHFGRILVGRASKAALRSADGRLRIRP